MPTFPGPVKPIKKRTSGQGTNIGDDVAFDQPVGLTIQLQDRPWTILYYILSKPIGK